MDSTLPIDELLRAQRRAGERLPFAWASRPGLPQDVRYRLVWADVLLQRGDARGEQLVLEHVVEHEPPGPTWAEDARALLRQVEQRGFVCVPDDPDASLLPFDGLATNPLQYHTRYAGRSWTVQYRRGVLSVTRDRARYFDSPLPLENSVEWTDADVNLYLHAASDCIRSGEPFALPSLDDPRRRPGPYPRYRVPGGGTVAARDISRWNAVYRRLG